jgi:O-antigen/teichoic acid export membrane protein
MKLLQHEWGRISRSPLARNATWMMAGQGANLLLQAVYFAVLGRLLGSTQYGILIGAYALTYLLTTFSAMGSGTLLVRYVSVDRKQFPVYWGSVLLMTCGFSLLLIVGARFAAPHILNPASASLVLVAGVGNCLCNELIRNSAMVFQTFERMKITASLNAASNLARACAATWMFVFLHHATAYQWAVVALAVSALSAVASVVAVTVAYGWPRLSLRLMFQGVPEGFGYSFAGSASSVYNDIDKTMLSHYGMNLANGIYGLAYRVIDVATSPMAALRDAAVPRFFRDGHSNPMELRKLTEQLTRRAALATLLVAGVLYAAAPLIPFTLGSSFAQSVQAVRWLCLIPVFRAIHQMSGCAVMGLGKQTYRTIAQLMVAGFNLSLNVFWIPAYGWRGAAASSLLSDGLLAALSWGLLIYLTRVTHHLEVPTNPLAVDALASLNPADPKCISLEQRIWPEGDINSSLPAAAAEREGS